MGLATRGRRPNRYRNAYNKQPKSDETAVARCPRPLTSERAGGSPNMSQIKIDKANVQEITVNHTSNNHIINQPKTFTLGFPWHSHHIPMAFPCSQFEPWAHGAHGAHGGHGAHGAHGGHGGHGHASWPCSWSFCANATIGCTSPRDPLTTIAIRIPRRGNHVKRTTENFKITSKFQLNYKVL